MLITVWNFNLSVFLFNWLDSVGQYFYDWNEQVKRELTNRYVLLPAESLTAFEVWSLKRVKAFTFCMMLAFDWLAGLFHSDK